MRVAINCRSFLNKDFTGIGRYTSQLIRTLAKIDPHNEYLLYAPKSYFNIRRKIPKISEKNLFLRIDRFKRGIDRTVGSMDVYHAPCPERLNVECRKIVVTVHDLIFKTFPQGHRQETISETEEQFRDILRRASKIICCSQSTLNDLKRYFQMNENQAVVIYQGVQREDFYPIGPDEELIAQAMLRVKGIEQPYLLFVGTLEPRKNLKNILEAFRILRQRKQFLGKLVLIGGKGWMNEDLKKFVEQLELAGQVVFTGFVTNQELRFFYNKAEVFLFPSLYEGFGFPIVEAFSCGAPVVTSNVSSCPEIARDAALKVDPASVEEIVEATNRIINDAKLKKDLRGKGLKRAGDFSSEMTARRTLAVYQDVYRSS